MYITIDQVQLFYEQHGQGRDILLLHGWGIDSSFFKPIFDELSKDYRVTVVDLPGHGKSEKPPEPWGVAEYALLVCHFMDELGLKNPTVVGHSNGGRIAIYIASHWPQYVHKLVVTGGAGLKKAQTKAQEKRSKSFQRKKRFYQWMKKIKIFGSLPDTLAEKLRMKYGSADYVALSPDMRPTFIRLISEDLTSLLPLIQAPTLLIWGDKDTETPLWMGKKMEENIPDGALIVFENGSHYAYLEQWKRFSIIVSQFTKEEI